MSSTEIRKLFRLVDWVMALPPPQMKTFQADMAAFEKEKEVPFITAMEQMWLDQGEAKGRSEGRSEGLEAVLEVRFGDAGVALMPRIRQITDAAVLERLLRESKSVSDLAAFTAMLPPLPPQT
jgi:hypothetical protein